MISSNETRLLRDYLHSHQTQMQDLLKELILTESPSTVPSSQEKIVKTLTEAWHNRGYFVRYLPGRKTGGHLLALPKKRAQNQSLQLLLGHCDTVWPLGTINSMPLYTQGGKLYGPGSYDMKAGLVSSLFAVEAIQAQDLTLEVAPIIFINSDEEIGSIESTSSIRKLAQRVDRAFVLEPSLGVSGKLKTRRKGVGRFTVQVIGKAAHAGLDPEKGASAILELSFVIQKLFALNDPIKGISVNVGTIDGGIRSNVIAPESKAIVDVRILNLEDVPEIEQKILNLEPTIPGTQLMISGGIGRPPLEKTPANQLLWQKAQQAATELGIELEEGTAGGGSDGNTTSIYTATLDGLGAVGDQAHAPGEFIYLDSLVERTALLSRLLLEPALKFPGDQNHV
jgi:glutamate carboxypeptidase